MKKLILFALTLVLIGSLLTACRWGTANDTTAPTDTSAATTQPTTQPTTAPRPTVPDNIPDDNMSDPSGNSTEGTNRRRMIDGRI